MRKLLLVFLLLVLLGTAYAVQNAQNTSAAAPATAQQPVANTASAEPDLFGGKLEALVTPVKIVIEDHKGGRKAPSALAVTDPATGKPTQVMKNKRYDILVNISKARRISIRNALVKGESFPVKIEDVPANKRFKSIVAIDLSEIDFANATYYMKATGYELFKCKLWNYAAQQCDGSWVKVKDTVPGKTYAIKLGPNDPALAEGSGIFFDGFENGLGANNWTINGTGNKWTANTTNPYNGTRHAQANQPTAGTTMRINISTQNYTSITLSYARRLVQLDAADEFQTRWYNGTVWQVLEATGSAAANEANYVVRNYTLGSSAENNTKFAIEFTCQANLANEYCRVDDVRVNSTGLAEKTPPAISETRTSSIMPFVGDSICLLANVTDASGVKSVTAQIRLPNGSSVILPLYDGLTCNSEPNDGTYSNHIIVPLLGTYNWTLINATDNLNNLASVASNRTFEGIGGLPQTYNQFLPNLSRYNNGTLIDTALINTSNNVYATQAAPGSSTTFMYFNWTLNLTGDIYDSNATIEHSYSATSGVTATLQILNGTNWQHACALTVSTSDATDTCNLYAFMNGNASAFSTLQLRINTTRTTTPSRTQYVDYVYASIATIASNELLSCGTLTSSKQLGRSITSATTCLDFGADNIILDCKGYEINYNSWGSWGQAITASNRNNITVRNCIIRDINASGTGSYGIILTNVNYSSIANSTIITNGTTSSHGILVQGPSQNNTISNNTISARGTNGFNLGIYLLTSVQNTIIEGNNINTTGNGSNHGILLDTNAAGNTIRNNTIRTSGIGSFNAGILLLYSAANNSITGNIIRTNGTGSSHGILLQTGAANNTIANNTVNTSGSSSFNVGIYLTANSSDNQILSNNVRTNGTTDNTGLLLENDANNNMVVNNTLRSRGTSYSNDCLQIILSSGNRIDSNTITSNGTTTNHGIKLENRANRNTLANNTIIASGSANFNVGVLLILGSLNNTVENNTVSTIGTDSNHGFFIASASDDNMVSLNHITISGVSGYGVGIENISAIQIYDNILANPDFEFHIFNTSDASISGDFGNYSFENSAVTVEKKGKSKVKFNKKITGKGKKLSSAIIIGNNTVFVNNSAPEFNQSANITIYDINNPDLVIDVNFGENGEFEECPETICTAIANTPTETTVSVTHFTTYRILPARIHILTKSPANQAEILLNETVNINSNITATGSRKLDIIQANLTLPDGTMIELPFLNNTKDVFNSTLSAAQITERGTYIIAFFANDSKNIRNTTTTAFTRKALKIIDLVNSTNSFANYAPTVFANDSGILDLGITVANGKVKYVNITGHHESSPFSIIGLDDLEGADGLVSRTALDTTNFNATEVSTTVNATGTSVFHCANWDFSTRYCEGGWKKDTRVNPGQLYRIRLAGPRMAGYGEGNNVVDLLNSSGFLQSFTETADANPDSTSNVTIYIQNHPVKRIDLKHTDISLANDLRVDRMPPPAGLERRIVQQFAVDTGSLNFTGATLTINAKGTRLKKCAQWNITEQKCYGSWADVMNLTPGQDYTLSISPGDPGFQEINASDAWHLDTNRQIIENIYDSIAQIDGGLSPQIMDNEYARVLFARNLTANNTIDFVASGFGSGGVFVEIYPAGSDTLVGRVGDIISSPVHYYVKLSMPGNETYDTFDLKTVSDPMNVTSYITYDFIHDDLELEPGIRQVYSGQLAMTTQNITVPIGAEVSTSNSILFFSARALQNSPSNGLISGRILNTTHLEFIRASATGTINVFWYVAEFGPNIITTSYRNTMVGANTIINLTAPINTSSSFLVPQGWNNTGTIWGDDDFIRMRILNSTAVELRDIGAPGAGDAAYWQIVEFNGSNVQRGLIDMISTTKTVLVNLTTAVDLARAFLTDSYMVSGTINGANGNVLGRIVNATQLEFTRNGTGIVVNISWEVVELPTPNSVQTGVASFDENITEVNATITSINTSQSVAFASSGPIAGLSMGNSSAVGDDNPGWGMFTHNITSATNLKINRASFGVGNISSVFWQVIDFAPIVVRHNFTNITVSKVDYIDPINASTNQTYQISVTAVGNTTAFNVTLTDTYSTGVIYLTSQPSPTTGNNSWLLGNLTPGTNLLINITVLVLNVSNGTVINNTANVTWNNETTLASAVARANTTVISLGAIDAILLSPVANITTNITQNLTFTISANITCSGASGFSCGNVTALAQYNTTWNLSGDWYNTSFLYRMPVTFIEPAGLPQNNTHVLFNITLAESRLNNDNGTMLVCGGTRVALDAYALARSNGWTTQLEGLAELNFTANEVKQCYVYYDPAVNATEILPSVTGWYYACTTPYAYCGQPGLTNITPATASTYGSYANMSINPVTCGAATDYFTTATWCYFKAPVTGNLTLATASDDGSIMIVNGSRIVNNTYCQATTCRSGDTSLFSSGQYYKMKVAYDEYAGDSTL